MKRVSNILAWGALVIIAALCVLNWHTLMAPSRLDLVIWQGDAPLGLVMLAMAGVLLGFFLLAYLNNQISSLLENRKLLKEIQRVQALADKAEASRMENLHQLIATEFRLLHERLGPVSAMNMPSESQQYQPQPQPQPLSLTELVARR